MAIEIFPDSPSVGMSPRISFSHDLSQSDVVPVEQYIRSTSSSSSIDFDFCVFRESFDHESSSADELFFDGKILPIEIKKRLLPSTPPRRSADPPHLPPPPPPLQTQLQNFGNIPAKIPIPETEPKQSNSTNKSFWKFKRSTSLNCGSGYARTLCPLPLLSRSNSTGSASGGKRSSIANNNQKQNFPKYTLTNGPSNKPQYSSRPPLKKSASHASYGHGVKISPILMVPPASLFGFGSFFSGGGKDKSGRKK